MLKSSLAYCPAYHPSRSKHGTIEEILKNLDSSKFPVPDDWLEAQERISKRKVAREAMKARIEAKAENTITEGAAQDRETTDQMTGRDEQDNNVLADGGHKKRERDIEEGEEEELDDAPPMYRQARRLFLEPEVWELAA